MLKIYDCSLNKFFKDKHPSHQLNRETEFFKDLKTNAYKHGFQFINSTKSANVIITNTCFSPEALSYSYQWKVPRIKKVEGMTWKDDTICRAITHSDLNIFNSEYSKNEFIKNDGIDGNYIVIHDNIDENNNQIKINTSSHLWVSYSKNWDENKLNLAQDFSDVIKRNRESLCIIGKSSSYVPANISSIDTPESRKEWIEIIKNCKGVLLLDPEENNLQFILQCLRANLPIIYPNNGLLSEYIGNKGIPINMNRMDREELDGIYYEIDNFRNKIVVRNYEDTIKEWFSEIYKCCSVKN